MSLLYQPRHRGITLVSAFAMSVASLAGMGVLTAAPAQAATIDQTGVIGNTAGSNTISPTPSPSPVNYISITDNNSKNLFPPDEEMDLMSGNVNQADLQAAISNTMSSLESTAYNFASGNSSYLSTYPGTTVLAGDTLQFYGVIALGAPGGYVWSPDVTTAQYKGLYDFTYLTAQPQIAPTSVISQVNPAPVCDIADGIPNLAVNGSFVLGLGCDGAADFHITYNNLSASANPTSDQGPFFDFRVSTTPALPQYLESIGVPATQAGAISGLASRVAPGAGQSPFTSGQFSVVNPKLELKKQVCSTGTGCDPNSDTGWIADNTYGDQASNVVNSQETTGLSDGVKQGVESALVAPTTGNTIQWRLTATNSGNISLYKPRIGEDLVTVEPSSGYDESTPQVTSNTCAPDTLFPMGKVPSGDDMPLVPGASVSMSCTTTFSEALGTWAGSIQNTAALNADMPAAWAVYNLDSPPYNENLTDTSGTLGIAPLENPNATVLPNGKPITAAYTIIPFIDPYGNPLVNRFSGYSQTTDASGNAISGPPVQGVIPSNIDSAQLSVAAPDLKVTKWVCSTGTGCPQWSQLTAAQQASLSGYYPTQSDPVSASQEVPASGNTGGWVKATTVPYNSSANWLVVTTNTGDTYLSNIVLTDDSTINPDGIQSTPEITPIGDQNFTQELTGVTLAPGTSVATILTTNHVTATGSPGNWENGSWAAATTDGPGSYPNSGEKAYIVGDDLVNTVTASAIPVQDASGTPILDPDNGNVALGSIPSNTSRAEVNAVPPSPSVKVTKYVCTNPDPTKCVAPTGPGTLASLGGVSVAADGTITLTAGQPIVGTWEKEGTVPFNTTATWLMVVTNTGNTSLSNIQLLNDTLINNGHGVSSTPTDSSPAVIGPGQSATFIMTTPNITNVQAAVTGIDPTVPVQAAEPGYNTGDDVINTTGAQATPSDAQGNTLAVPNTVFDPTNSSTAVDPMSPVVAPNTSNAEVNTVVPTSNLKVTKWVCGTPTGTGCSPSPNLNALSGVRLNASTGLPVVTTGQPDGGWVKETTVNYDSNADWLVVVANIGQTPLMNVTLHDTQPGNSQAGHGSTSASGLNPAAVNLAVGAQQAYILTTSSITNTNPTVPDAAYDCSAAAATGNAISTITCEPTTAQEQANVGSDVVNWAYATGTPASVSSTGVYSPLVAAGSNTDASGNPVSTVPADSVRSNDSAAEVNANTPPQGSLQLAKYVCSYAAGCTPAAQLSNAQMTVLKDPASQGTAGWVPAATVEYNHSAQWLLVLTNTDPDITMGNVQVAAETLTDNGAAGAVPAGCAVGTAFSTVLHPVSGQAANTLLPLQSAVLTCTTASVTNTNPLDGETDMVNTAQAQGNPLASDGTPMPAPNQPAGTTTPELLTTLSNTDTAEVNTVLPAPSLALAKWVCSTGTGCTPWAQLTAAAQATLADKDSTPAATDTATGGWVKGTKVVYGSDAQWLVVAQNTGNVTLTSVQLTQEDVDNDATLSGCAVGDAFTPSTLTGDITGQGQGQIGAITTCTSPEIVQSESDTVTNTATAEGTPVDSGGQPIPDKDNPGQNLGPTESNQDSATVYTEPPNPSIQLAKWVCSTGTNCPAWSQLTSTQQANVTNSSDTPPTDADTGGWVKSTGVNYASAATWLLVATNNGNTELSNVKVSAETMSLSSQGVPAGCAVGTAFSPSVLAPNASGVVTCSTPVVTNTTAELVNTATATGTPTEPDGDPIPSPDNPDENWPDIPSNPSQAQVDTTYSPSIQLAKWVCSTGTGCPAWADLSADGQKILSDPNSTPAASDTATGGYIKATTVDYNTDAQWLIVTTNTGKVQLSNVHFSFEQIVGDDQSSATGCAQGGSIDTLLGIGDSAGVTCTTPTITNGAALGSGNDVINTAEATGTPVLGDGVTRVPAPDNGTTPVDDVRSNQDKAEVNTRLPEPGVTIVKYDTLNGDDSTSGHYPNSNAPKTLTANEPTPISMTITNSGTDALVDVTVTDSLVSGSGALTGLSCDFSPLGGPATGTTWAGPFAVGASFTCTGTVPGLAVGETHENSSVVTGTGQASGKPVTDSDDWNGRVPPPPGTPTIDIIKYDTLNGDNITTGHHPNSSAPKYLTAGKPTPISFTVTNNGAEALVDVVVVDKTTAGVGTITGLSCDFSPLGGPSSGTTWAGPFVVGASFTCSGTLPALKAGQTHTNASTVSGQGAFSGKTVSDTDQWNGKVPESPSIQTGGTVVADTAWWGGSLSLAALLAGLLVGTAVMIVRRRTAK